MRVEVIFQICNLIMFIQFCVGSTDSNNWGRFMEMIIMFRIIRVFNLMNELTSFRLIGDTFKALIMPFWTLIMVLFCVYYIWAMIGD